MAARHKKMNRAAMWLKGSIVQHDADSTNYDIQAKRRKTRQGGLEAEEGEIVEDGRDYTNEQNSSTSADIGRGIFSANSPSIPISQDRLTSLSDELSAKSRQSSQDSLTPMSNELCSKFCLTGTCWSSCGRIHDPSKITICSSILQGIVCANFVKSKCRLRHEWDFHIAPSCIYFLLGYCSFSMCTYAHNDHVKLLAPQCEQYKGTGYCDDGPGCDKIHRIGALPEIILETRKVVEDAKEYIMACGLEEKKAPVVFRPKVLVTEPDVEDKTARRFFGVEKIADVPEVVVGGETFDELALQEDFVLL